MGLTSLELINAIADMREDILSSTDYEPEIINWGLGIIDDISDLIDEYFEG